MTLCKYLIFVFLSFLTFNGNNGSIYFIGLLWRVNKFNTSKLFKEYKKQYYLSLDLSFSFTNIHDLGLWEKCSYNVDCS